ncbi:SAM-dependent methyltransferase [Undibacterium sp. TJN19]|uniref:SAM-dependent methyltransferase n=1 Tax=Undibacterium sp. TJN19 TaxID=3413055 RepID=UPI003BF1DB4D
MSSPAFHALLVQLVALFVSYSLYIFDKWYFGGVITPYLLLFFHSLLAVLISAIRRLSWWWWIIQFIFPFAVIASLIFQLRPALSLSVFAVMVLLFWSTYRTQVPYFPSKSSLLPCILEQLPTSPSLRFIDVGSGFGGLSAKLSSVRRDQYFYGVEIAPFPWFVSWIRAKFAAGKLRFFLQDYLRLNLGEFDVVFAYLSPAAMPGLWDKARSEMRTGTLLMSYEFPIPGVEPDLIIKSKANDPVLYVWRI